MKKILFVLAVILITAGCSAKNSEYVVSLQERGFTQGEIHAYIEYAKKNTDLPESGYVDITGRTVSDVAKDLGITVPQYIEEYDLPKNLPALASETEAMYTVPLSRMAKTYGMEFGEFIKSLNLPDDISPDTPWGKALSQVTLGDYVGENNVDKFREMYNLPDSVSADTLYGEILNDVDTVKKENRLKDNK